MHAYEMQLYLNCIITKIDMDEIIEMLTEKVTTDRPSLFGALDIDWKSIEGKLPTGESLKKRTGACLNTWFTEQQVKYWKYQELLINFRDSNLDSGAESIIERFGIKGQSDDLQTLKAFDLVQNNEKGA